VKIFSVVLTLTLDVKKYGPADWDWVALLNMPPSEGIEDVTVFDVTEGAIERVRLTATGPEEV
jgi:hypothetical protein